MYIYIAIGGQEGGCSLGRLRKRRNVYMYVRI